MYKTQTKLKVLIWKLNKIKFPVVYICCYKFHFNYFQRFHKFLTRRTIFFLIQYFIRVIMISE